MGALDRFLRRGRQQDGYKPMIKRLEAAMLAACRAAGASAWYVPDDYLVLGPELVPSGVFDSGAGWTLGGGWAISGGKLTATAAATGSSSVINAGLVAGKSYLVAYDIDSISAGATTPIANGATSTQQTTRGQKVSIITPAGSTGNVGLNSSSATALSVTFDNFSVREILSAKDFQDSAGMLPSYLGGTVGLGLDATATTSAELVGDVDFNDPSNWNLAVVFPATSTVTGGKLRIYSPAGESSSAIQAVSRGTATVGKLYKFTLDVEAYTGAAGIHFAGAGETLIPAGVGIKTIYAVADGAQFGIKRTGVCDITINSISVKEISGNAVTQATAGNRPLVSRIPRKLGPELVTNGTFDADASWTKGTGWSISGGLATKAAGVAASLDQVVNLSGKNVAVSFTVSGRTAGTVSALLVESGVGTSTLGSASANGSFTFVGVRPTTGVFRINSDSVFDGSIDNIIVREVLEWSNAIAFDGTNDALATAASVIGANLSQPYTMIAWGKVGPNPTGRWMVGDSARLIGVSTNNKVSVGHAGTASYDSTYTIAGGESVIMEATYDGGSAVNIAVNGTSVFSTVPGGASRSPVTPATATTIGQRGNSTAYWSGDVGGVVICPAVMTDAQRLAVRRFAAAQMGMTL